MIKKEMICFLIVGILTVLFDFIAYTLCLWSHFFSVSFSKAFGFISGTFFAYLANRFWTFSHKKKGKGGAFKFAILYLSTLGVNVFVNSISIEILKDITDYSTQLSFLIATGLSATLNFLGMKFFVFAS